MLIRPTLQLEPEDVPGVTKVIAWLEGQLILDAEEARHGRAKYITLVEYIKTDLIEATEAIYDAPKREDSVLGTRAEGEAL